MPRFRVLGQRVPRAVVALALLPGMPAYAANLAVPSRYATVGEAVAAAAALGGSNTVTVAGGYTIDASEVDGVDVSGLTLLFQSDGGGRYALPPLRGTDATIDVVDAELTATAFWADSPLTGEDMSCALCVFGGTLTVTAAALDVTEGYGILAVDNTLTLDTVRAQSASTRQAVLIVSIYEPAFFSATTTDFADNAGGALKLYGFPGAPGITATLFETNFTDNAGNEGVAIYAYNADITMTGGNVTGNQAATTAPIQLVDTPAYFDGVTFRANDGANAGLMSASLGGFDVEVAGGVVDGHWGDSLEFNVVSTGTFTLNGVYWAPHTLLQRSGGALKIKNCVISPEVTANGIVNAVATEVTVTNNYFCSDGSDHGAVPAAVIVNGGSLTFQQNVLSNFNLTAADSSIFLVGDKPEVGATPTTIIADNTLVDVSAADLIRGETAGLTFENNLVDGSVASFDLADFGDGSLVDYNLWWNATVTAENAAFPSGSRLSEVSANPEFASAFTRAGCPSTPFLNKKSPAINTGDPALPDSVDGGRSDIGAFDYTEEWADPDTGADSGTSDTGMEDSGVVDTAENGDSGSEPDGDSDGFTVSGGDCDDANAAISPDATDEPGDGVDQNCDGADASVTYAGGCGCSPGTGPGEGALAALGALLSLATFARRPRC